MEKLKVSIEEIVAATGESRGNVYTAMNRGLLKTFLVGRRRYARPAAVRAWVDFLEAQSDAGTPVLRDLPIGTPHARPQREVVAKAVAASVVSRKARAA